MSKSNIYSILSIFLLFMAIIQAPIFYYYTFGMIAILIIVPYVVFGFGLTIWLLVVIVKKSDQITRTPKITIGLTFLIGSFTLIFGESLIEKLDWNLRKNDREVIIELIKEDKIQPNGKYNNGIAKLSNWNFPPISNGGNEITIYKTESSKVTVEFYINRGFLDHYSAFVYTNDTEKIKELEEHMSYQKGLQLNKKLDENWYRVSY
ncbi:hypothetical protein KZP23_14605 [Echinicola marina]|uniref:hypothetical protein n=1 Tax=Echinicola marina TaxID=2859768 RepID=UPI001CF714AA|nr:hypothetical protein [Echinicola marina]UCS91952.1 hypothetical protein KZP23_14605 [Echinicola marina]